MSLPLRKTRNMHAAPMQCPVRAEYRIHYARCLRAAVRPMTFDQYRLVSIAAAVLATPNKPA